MKIEDFVCTAPPTASLSGLGNCMLEIEMPSPIDFYIKIPERLFSMHYRASRPDG